VMERLERIEALQRADAPAAALLAEVRKLLCEGEAWLVAEGPRGGDALAALGRCRGSVEDGEEVTPVKRADKLG
jgi:hypothetical protein